MIIILETRMLYLILSGLRLHVTGLMKNANNLITISCFLPKKIPSMGIYWSSFYTKHYTVNHFRAKRLTPLMQPEITEAHSLCKNWRYFQFTDKWLVISVDERNNYWKGMWFWMLSAVCWGGLLCDETKTAARETNRQGLYRFLDPKFKTFSRLYIKHLL